MSLPVDCFFLLFILLKYHIIASLPKRPIETTLKTTPPDLVQPYFIVKLNFSLQTTSQVPLSFFLYKPHLRQPSFGGNNPSVKYSVAQNTRCRLSYINYCRTPPRFSFFFVVYVCISLISVTCTTVKLNVMFPIHCKHHALPKIPSVLTNLWNLGGVM